eukprot:2897544-Amphidinium_carterae.1
MEPGNGFPGYVRHGSGRLQRQAAAAMPRRTAMWYEELCLRSFLIVEHDPLRAFSFGSLHPRQKYREGVAIPCVGRSAVGVLTGGDWPGWAAVVLLQLQVQSGNMLCARVEHPTSIWSLHA